MVDVAVGQRAMNEAALEMTSRHHLLISQLAEVNEQVHRASAVAMETQIAANKASHVVALRRFHYICRYTVKFTAYLAYYCSHLAHMVAHLVRLYQLEQHLIAVAADVSNITSLLFHCTAMGLRGL